ncbi:MAG: septal ring lytic transglycosylase RlpA family protein [Solirubrobacteraceae bacterium]
MRRIHVLSLVAALIVLPLSTLAGWLPALAPHAALAATCHGVPGPGIPPPSVVPSGLPGFHAAWYGQSGYPRVCPGAGFAATVAFINTGSRGWVAGRMGESAYLGTWEPSPGQDRATILGGDGTNGSPATGWPRFNRPAAQPAAYVGPGQVAWFQFTVQAPLTPGIHRFAIRPLIEGAQWMEDHGVFWQITVLNPDGTLPAPPPPAPPPSASSITVVASWFGPGFYGNRTACGQIYTSTMPGVAHRTLPCGTQVTLSYAGRTVTVGVIDRGPFVAGREFDLTNATRLALGCPDICTLQWRR